MKLRVLRWVLLPLLLLVVLIPVAKRRHERQKHLLTHELVRMWAEEYPDDARLQRVRELLRQGADPNAHTEAGNPLLWEASGEVEVTRALVAAGANVNARGSDGSTPLMKAAHWYMKEETQCSRILLSHGANPNLRDRSGRTALLRSAGNCGEVCWWNTDIARMLLDHGAQVDAVDSNGNTTLLLAAALPDDMDNGDMIGLLLSRGADPTHRNKKG